VGNQDRRGPFSSCAIGQTVIRLSKLADYGIVIATHLARHPDRQQTAPEVAAATSVPAPMTSKILKLLTRGEILVSHRGVRGGYGLGRPAEAITVAEVIEALDGPIAITSCMEPSPHDCGILSLCPARANWQRINGAIREALDGVTLAEMAHSIPAAFLLPEERQLLDARL
jgi:FeS assembly SUF system regulator